MNIATVHLAETEGIPPITGFYQYVIAREGLYLRAANDVLAAMVLIAAADRDLPGLAALDEYAELRLPQIPLPYLVAMRASARRALPNEALYQLRYADGEWKVAMPRQFATPTSLTFDDLPDTLLDLHSHGEMSAFFSATDDADELGLRLYVVIGKVESEAPEIRCRVGVYGHFLNVPAANLFESIGPFVDRNDAELSRSQDSDDLAIRQTAAGKITCQHEPTITELGGIA